MRVAGVTVFTTKLAASVGVDGVRHAELAFGDGFVEDGASFHRFELDEVAIVGVLRFGGESSHAGGAAGQNGEECRRVGERDSVRHFFASGEVKLRLGDRAVKGFRFGSHAGHRSRSRTVFEQPILEQHVLQQHFL